MDKNKHILFFSEQCNHCSSIIDKIKDIGISKYLLINVDKEQFPNFVDRVPCLLTNEKNVLIEDGLVKFLNKQLNIEPFMVNEMGKVSDQYSYIEENGVLEHNFQFVNKESKIITPNEDEVKKIINYEKILEERDNDLKGLLANNI
jgi:glutaredoxin-related protein